MTNPFPFDGKTTKALISLGGGVVLGLAALYILYKVVLSGQVALSEDVSKIKEETTGIKIQTTQIIGEHIMMNSKVDVLQKDLIEEAKKQTVLQQKMCVRQSRTTKEAADCLNI